jgi:uncharacterized protein (DUF849 family)
MTQMQDLLQKLTDAQIIAAEQNRMAVIAAEKSKEAVEENTKEIQALSQAMLLHNTKQENFEILVEKHENVLYGTPERKGYLQRFDIIEDKVVSTLKNISIATWFVAGSIFSGVGVWIWQVISKAGQP